MHFRLLASLAVLLDCFVASRRGDHGLEASDACMFHLGWGSASLGHDLPTMQAVMRHLTGQEFVWHANLVEDFLRLQR